MAFIFQPITVKPVPPRATILRAGGKPVARWKTRGGRVVTAELTADGKKCRAPSPVFWVEYRDAKGKRQRVPGSRIRAAAEHKMALIVVEVERQKGGLAPTAGTTGDTLIGLATEYRAYLTDSGRTAKHAKEVRRCIVVVATASKWVTVADVTLRGWARWAGAQDLSAEQINHHLRALRGLLNWLVRTDRLGSNPLAAADQLNAEADRRLIRRALSASDFRRLIDTTRASGKRRQHLDGPSRAALYLFAARTGFRAGVLAKLRKEDVRLDDVTPHIPTGAAQQKSRKALSIPLSAAFVSELRAWLDARPEGLLWPGKWHYPNQAGAKILRRDMAAAGIPLVTADGGYDLHSLRGQCATDLALAGVPLHVTQRFLGHSTPALTSRFYLRTTLTDLAAAANLVNPPISSPSSDRP